MEANEMLDIVRRAAPWAKGMTVQETEFVVRRALGMGLDPLNPAEVQIWKDDKGRVNFQIGYQLTETWVKKVYGQHTQPRYTRLGPQELEAEGLPKTAIAYRCEFIMCSDLKAMADLAAIVGRDEALRMFTCVGLGVATEQEFSGAYFAPKGRSAAWKVQKRALTDAYRQKFGVPTAPELAEVKQRLGYALPTADDYEQAALTTSDPVALDTLAQARANDRALPSPTVTVEQAAALLYGDEQPTPATKQAPAPAVPAVPGDVTEVAPAEPAPATPAPAQNGSREWPFPVLQAVLQARLSDGTIGAKKALALSNLSADCTPDQATAWMRVYRAARDEGSNPQDAANRANGA